MNYWFISREKKIFSFFFVILLSTITFTQQDKHEVPQKPLFEIKEEIIEDLGEEELLTSDDKTLQAEEEDNIVIQGEDELLIQSRKRPAGLIQPSSEKSTEWSFYEKPAFFKDIQESDQPEKIAGINVGYGLYNHVNIDVSINTGLKNQTHSILYQRTYKEGEGRDGRVLENSELNFDQFVATSVFKVSDIYRLFFRGYFILSGQGLQENLLFDSQSQRGILLELAHQFIFFEQKVNLSLEFQNVTSEVLGTSSQINFQEGDFTSGIFKGSWDYFFGERNSVGLATDFFYADNALYYDQRARYLQGRLGGWLLTPVYSAFLGEKSIPWDLHIRLRFDLFLSEQVNPVPVPGLDIESQLGFWQIRLSVYRETETPNIVESYLEKNFFKPIHFLEPSDKWQASLFNQFYFRKFFKFSFETGFIYYTSYYFPSLDVDNLYQYNSQLLRFFYGRIGWEHKPFSFLGYSFGFTGEYFLDTVQFRPPIYFFVNINAYWKKFDFQIVMRFSDSRNTPEQLLPLYILLDMNLSYEVTNLIKFYANLQNILDQQYVILPPYNTSGIILLVGVKVQI